MGDTVDVNISEKMLKKMYCWQQHPTHPDVSCHRLPGHDGDEHWSYLHKITEMEVWHGWAQ